MLTASYIISKGSASIIHLWATVSSNGFVSNVIRKSEVALSNEDRRRGFAELSGRPVMWKESILVSNLHEKDRINISNWYNYEVFFKLKIIKKQLHFAFPAIPVCSHQTKYTTIRSDLKKINSLRTLFTCWFLHKKAMKG